MHWNHPRASPTVYFWTSTDNQWSEAADTGTEQAREWHTPNSEALCKLTHLAPETVGAFRIYQTTDWWWCRYTTPIITDLAWDQGASLQSLSCHCRSSYCLWVREYPIKDTQEEAEVAHNTAVWWLCEVCSTKHLQTPQQHQALRHSNIILLGGPGVVVQTVLLHHCCQ